VQVPTFTGRNRLTPWKVVIWGVVLTCHAAAHDFPGLATARFFLGVFEASIQPVTMVIFTMWYKRKEQPLRIGIWIGCAGLGYIVAGIASFGIGHIDAALPSWRYTFIIWGAITIAWGVVVLVLLPDNPQSAKFLTEFEKQCVLERIKGNETGVENKEWKAHQFWEALTDAKSWLLFLFAVASNAPNGGLTTFQGLIIRGLGFSTLRTTLIQMPSGGVQFIVCVSACFVASSYENARFSVMLACLVPALAGVLGMWLLPQTNPYGRLVCLWITFSYTASWSLSMSVVTANTAGHTKKATSAAILLIGYCLGNFIGPFFFLSRQAPRYELGVGMMLACIAIQVLCILSTWALLWNRNRRRAANNAARTQDVVDGQNRALNDETDLQNPNFKVSPHPIYYIFDVWKRTDKCSTCTEYARCASDNLDRLRYFYQSMILKASFKRILPFFVEYSHLRLSIKLSITFQSRASICSFINNCLTYA
jgi:ACS family allantoate permease-like MFS transporter